MPGRKASWLGTHCELFNRITQMASGVQFSLFQKVLCTSDFLFSRCAVAVNGRAHIEKGDWITNPFHVYDFAEDVGFGAS